MYRATGDVVVRELGDADTFNGIVLATPEELEDPRPQKHDAAWYTARAQEINEHIETSGYIPPAPSCNPVGASLRGSTVVSTSSH